MKLLRITCWLLLFCFLASISYQTAGAQEASFRPFIGQLYFTDWEGKEGLILGETGEIIYLDEVSQKYLLGSFSPDGRYSARCEYTTGSTSVDIYVHDFVDNRDLKVVTGARNTSCSPKWGADSNTIYFDFPSNTERESENLHPGPDMGIWQVEVSTGQQSEIVPNGYWPVISPNRRWILFKKIYQSGIWDLQNHQLVSIPDVYWQADASAWSPDGNRLAYTAGTEGCDIEFCYGIFILDLDSGQNHQIYVTPGRPNDLLWTNDGKNIAFFPQYGEEARNLTIIRPDGTGLTVIPTDGEPYASSPDGNLLVINYSSWGPLNPQKSAGGYYASWIYDIRTGQSYRSEYGINSRYTFVHAWVNIPEQYFASLKREAAPLLSVPQNLVTPVDQQYSEPLPAKPAVITQPPEQAPSSPNESQPLDNDPALELSRDAYLILLPVALGVGVLLVAAVAAIYWLRGSSAQGAKVLKTGVEAAKQVYYGGKPPNPPPAPLNWSKELPNPWNLPPEERFRVTDVGSSPAHIPDPALNANFEPLDLPGDVSIPTQARDSAPQPKPGAPGGQSNRIDFEPLEIPDQTSPTQPISTARGKAPGEWKMVSGDDLDE